MQKKYKGLKDQQQQGVTQVQQQEGVEGIKGDVADLLHESGMYIRSYL